MTSRRQLAEWDAEYFDYMDSLIDEFTERQWQESQDEQRALHCMAQRDGWTCTALRHDDEAHVFEKESWLLL